MKYRKERAAACATKNPPGCHFQRYPDLPRISLSLSTSLSLPHSPCGLAALFAPKSNKCHCVNYEAATEDNWILIRFLFPLSLVVIAVLCFLLRPPLSIHLIRFPDNPRREKEQGRERKGHSDSSRVTVFPMISNFWQDWITGISVLAKNSVLYYLIDRGIKTEFNYDVEAKRVFPPSAILVFAVRSVHVYDAQVADKSNLFEYVSPAIFRD